MAEEINKNQLLEQKKAVFDMIVEGPKLPGEAEAKEDDPYSLDTERGAQLYASFSDDELLELLRGSAQRLGHSPSQGAGGRPLSPRSWRWGRPAQSAGRGNGGPGRAPEQSGGRPRR